MNFLTGLGFVCLGVGAIWAFIRDLKVRKQAGEPSIWAASVGIDQHGKPIGLREMMTAMAPGLAVPFGLLFVLIGLSMIFSI